MKKVYNKTLCRVAQEKKTEQTVAVLELSFDITGKHKDYLAFLDYINDLDRATVLKDVVIPMTVKLDNDDEEMNELMDEFQSYDDNAKKKTDILCTDDTVLKEVTVNLLLFCVEPMEDLATLQAGDASIVVNQ